MLQYMGPVKEYELLNVFFFLQIGHSNENLAFSLSVRGTNRQTKCFQLRGENKHD